MAGPDLDEAFRATRYVAELSTGPLVLRIGQPSPMLDRWLLDQGAVTYAWLTAVNPGARRCSAAANRDRLSKLMARLRGLGQTWVVGCAVADAADWPDEPSLLVAGLDCVTARALAAEFGQMAIVCGKAGGAPELVWLGAKL